MNDQFMQFDFEAENAYDDATMLLIDFANGDLSQVYMPVMAVNRTGLPNLYDPSLSIPDNPAIWVITPQFADAILYEPALKTPTFASVEAECKLDAYKENLDIKVTGNITEGVLPEDEQLYLSVYVMEDDVFTDSQEMPDDAEFNALYPDGTYMQQNVIRLCLTPLYGTAVGKGGSFSKEFTVELDSEWKVDDMSVVAFLTRSEKNDCMNRTVINATETFLSDADGVESIAAGRAENAAQQIFSLTGQRVNHPQKGIYVVAGKKIVIR
ncbi:MAG: Omp28-related outer membrane protein [Bacteroidaceae bacterium]|nr:Omp28-related outer membrane protein [Bacteroidaceae bacterium]